MSGELIGAIGTIIGCFIGLAGWLSGRDKKISNDAEWRGVVNTKLDSILGIRTDVDCLEKEVKGHGERITAVESSVKSAHQRLDKVEAKG
jgi:hypothetical protein